MKMVIIEMIEKFMKMIVKLESSICFKTNVYFTSALSKFLLNLTNT